jgi:hypothetical protein
MQAFIGAKLLSSNGAQPSTKPFEIYDSRLRGFTLRVQPTGMHSYFPTTRDSDAIAGLHWVRLASFGLKRHARNVRSS